MTRQLFHSQNFLKSPNRVIELIEQSSIGINDIVYEIGSGTGVITRELAKRCRQVIAIELDRNLFEDLQKKFKNDKNITIIFGDFLAYQLPSSGAYKIFSNIPFNTTADIIRKITSATNPPSDTYLIIQNEAALKFLGQPYGRETQYSILLKPEFELQIITRLNRNDFVPRPNVDTVLIQIKRNTPPLVPQNEMQLYRDFIVYSFNQWKPNLRESLNKVFTQIQFQKLATDLHFNRKANPTDLDFDQWHGLFKYFLTGVANEKQAMVHGSEHTLRNQQQKLNKIHRTKRQLGNPKSFTRR